MNPSHAEVAEIYDVFSEELQALHASFVRTCDHEITLPKDLTTVKQARKQYIQEVVELVEVA